MSGPESSSRPRTPGIYSGNSRWIAIVCLLALALLVFSGLAWLAPRGLIFGRWQGMLLDPHPPVPVPFLSHVVMQGISGFVSGDSLLWLGNIASAIAGAIALIVLAAAATAFSPPEDRHGSACAGLAVGTLLLVAFLGTTHVLTAFTELHPAALTLSFAMLAIAAYQWAQWSSASAPLMLSGIFAALASVNHPSIAWLLVLVLIAEILWGRGERLNERLILFVAAAALAMALAVVSQLRMQTLPLFLSHALDAPYPTLFEAIPQFAMGREVLVAVPFTVLPLALLGLLHPARGLAFISVGMLLLFGPCLPAFTNAPGIAGPLVDNLAPMLLAALGLCLLAALGAALLLGWARRLAFPRIAPAALFLALGAALLIDAAPPSMNPHAGAANLAASIAGESTRPGIVVAGTPELYALLRAAAIARPANAPVLVYEKAVSDWWGRTQLAQAYGKTLKLPGSTPEKDRVQHWQGLLPFHADEFDSGTPAPPPAWNSLLLHDLMELNLARHQFIFAAAAAPWVPARAQVHGPVLIFPAGDAGADEFYPPVAAGASPAARATYAALTTSLSDAMRVQDYLGLAEDYARAAVRLNPVYAPGQIALLRALARQGTSTTLLERALGQLPAEVSLPEQAFADLLVRDLRAQAAAAELETVLQGSSPPDSVSLEPLFLKLWQSDELAVLEEAYRAIVELSPRDLNALYQLAAVQAQRGQWEEADESLAVWAARGGYALAQVMDQLRGDGRFHLFLSQRESMLKHWTPDAAPPLQS